MESNEVPRFNKPDFKCPRCHYLSQHQWYPVFDFSTTPGQTTPFPSLHTSRCLRCKLRAIWLDEVMIYPGVESKAPEPSVYMPDLVKQDVEEARAVLCISPRASCALLRLATEKLCRILVSDKHKFDKAIDVLVKQGVSAYVQQGLDVIRVTGNEAVHSGQLVDEDTEGQAIFMFELLNVIVDERIGLGKRLQNALDSMPEGVRKHIMQRSDGNATNA